MSLSYAKLMVAKLKKDTNGLPIPKDFLRWMNDFIFDTLCIKTTKLWGIICIFQHAFCFAKLQTRRGMLVVPVLEESSFSKYCNI